MFMPHAQPDLLSCPSSAHLIACDDGTSFGDSQLVFSTVASPQLIALINWASFLPHSCPVAVLIPPQHDYPTEAIWVTLCTHAAALGTDIPPLGPLADGRVDQENIHGPTFRNGLMNSYLSIGDPAYTPTIPHRFLRLQSSFTELRSQSGSMPSIVWPRAGFEISPFFSKAPTQLQLSATIQEGQITWN